VALDLEHGHVGDPGRNGDQLRALAGGVWCPIPVARSPPRAGSACQLEPLVEKAVASWAERDEVGVKFGTAPFVRAVVHLKRNAPGAAFVESD
jgi:hypothetical protein